MPLPMRLTVVSWPATNSNATVDIADLLQHITFVFGGDERAEEIVGRVGVFDAITLVRYASMFSAAKKAARRSSSSGSGRGSSAACDEDAVRRRRRRACRLRR